MKPVTVALYVDVNEASHMAEISEQFARTLSGLAMRDIYGYMSIEEGFAPVDDDEED